MDKRRIVGIVGLVLLTAATVAATSLVLAQQPKEAAKAVEPRPKAEARPKTIQITREDHAAILAKRDANEAVPTPLAKGSIRSVAARGLTVEAVGRAVKVHAAVRVGDREAQGYVWTLLVRAMDQSVVKAHQYDEQPYVARDKLCRTLTFDEAVALEPGKYWVGVYYNTYDPTRPIPAELWKDEVTAVAKKGKFVTVAE